MLELLVDCLADALVDSAKLIPFLFVIYILLEIFDRKTGNEFYQLVRKANKLGPLFGGIIGVIPQCGLSAAAASLYAGKVISIGTMLAVFLSASDDMLPIFISSAVPVAKIIKILAVKVIIGIVTGYIIDILWKRTIGKGFAPANAPVKMMSKKGVNQAVAEQRCTASCCMGPFWIVVIKHTLQVFAYIFGVSFILNMIIGFIGENVIAAFFANVPILGHMISGAIGLIPNCASSVIITELYVSGVMSIGALFAGLLANAGVGILILARNNKNKKETATIIALLYLCSIAWGMVIEIARGLF